MKIVLEYSKVFHKTLMQISIYKLGPYFFERKYTCLH